MFVQRITIFMFFIAVAGVAAFFLYLRMIKPCSDRKEKFKPFEKYYFAHRGLFDNDGDAPENSLAAFQRAIDAGYGIEFDVWLSDDGKVFVLHDGSLKRMTGVDKLARKCTYDEMRKLKLANSDEHIPLFEEVLRLVDGQVPILIEIKHGINYWPMMNRVRAALEDYKGQYMIESFNPLVLFWVRRNMPHILRGQLAMGYHGFFELNILPRWTIVILSNLLENGLSMPDFISYDFHKKNKLSFRICRNLYGVETFAWTIQSQQELDSAKDMYDIFIFEGFVPNQN